MAGGDEEIVDLLGEYFVDINGLKNINNALKEKVFLLYKQPCFSEEERNGLEAIMKSLNTLFYKIGSIKRDDERWKEESNEVLGKLIEIGKKLINYYSKLDKGGGENLESLLGGLIKMPMESPKDYNILDKYIYGKEEN